MVTMDFASLINFVSFCASNNSFGTEICMYIVHIKRSISGVTFQVQHFRSITFLSRESGTTDEDFSGRNSFVILL